MVKKYLAYLLLLFACPILAKQTLTVYTYDSFAAHWGPGPAIKIAFENECDCTLKLITFADGVALLNRLRMEGKKSAADVVIGLDNNLLQAAQQTGLFAENNVDTSKLNIPGGWHNNTFLPYDYGYFAFVYNKDKLHNPPTSLHELVNSDQPWKIIYQDPRISTPGLGLLLWMQKVFGDQTPLAWQQLTKKTVTVTKSWSEAYGLFMKGESDMVLSYTTSPLFHLIEEKKDNYASANFSEGHYLQIELAAKLKNSQQPELAERFMQFIVSMAFQSQIPTGNWMYPVINMQLPAGFEQIAAPETALQFSAEEIAQKQGNWVRSWQTSVSH